MRDNFLIGMIGVNGAGKTTTAQKIAMAYKQSRSSKNMIISHDPQNKFGRVTDYYIQSDDNEWAEKLVNIKNCLLILDDYKLINENPRAIKGFQKILINRRANNVDIMYMCHNPSLVLNLLAYFTTHYYLYFTKAQEGSFDGKIPDYSLCITACNIVNRHVGNFGPGKYPNFPYVIVDTDKKKLTAVNIKQSI